VKDYYHDMPYAFYSDFFRPFILKNLSEKNDTNLKRIFTFAEMLFESNDELLDNIAGLEIVESICFEKDFDDFKDLIFSRSGPKTIQSFNDTIEWFADEANLASLKESGSRAKVA